MVAMKQRCLQPHRSGGGTTHTNQHTLYTHANVDTGYVSEEADKARHERRAAGCDGDACIVVTTVELLRARRVGKRRPLCLKRA